MGQCVIAGRRSFYIFRLAFSLVGLPAHPGCSAQASPSA